MPSIERPPTERDARGVVAGDSHGLRGARYPAIRADDTVYLSGHIPFDPQTMELVSSDVREQIHQIFRNLRAVAHAAGGDFGDLLKLNIYLNNIAIFPLVNEVTAAYFDEPYSAGAATMVASPPKDARMEMEGVLVTKCLNRKHD